MNTSIITDKIQLINKYGLYDIPLSEIRKIEEYNFAFDSSDSLGSAIEDVKNIIEENKSLWDLYDDDKITPFILELDYVDVEINIFFSDQEIWSEYYICVKDENNEWESYDSTPTEIEIADFDTIEEKMYKELMRFCKEYELKWDKAE